MMERDESPPPPPPPPLDDDIPFTPPCYRSTPQRDIDHGTSILSEHEGPRSNVSVLSSSRTEDSEDDHRKKAKVFRLQLILILICLSSYIDIGRCGMSANETTLHPITIYLSKPL